LFILNQIKMWTIGDTLKTRDGRELKLPAGFEWGEDDHSLYLCVTGDGNSPVAIRSYRLNPDIDKVYKDALESARTYRPQ